jgi:hypothetical protein
MKGTRAVAASDQRLGMGAVREVVPYAMVVVPLRWGRSRIAR